MSGRRKRMLEGLDQDICEHIERETQDNQNVSVAVSCRGA
jgi:hypothetical protein